MYFYSNTREIHILYCIASSLKYGVCVCIDQYIDEFDSNTSEMLEIFLFGFDHQKINVVGFVFGKVYLTLLFLARSLLVPSRWE